MPICLEATISLYYQLVFLSQQQMQNIFKRKYAVTLRKIATLTRKVLEENLKVSKLL